MSIHLVFGDITEQDCDVIVNAANNSLLGGGGVDGAIHRKAGPELIEECRQLGFCETGSAKISSGHNLKVKHIIHAVGPVWNNGNYGEYDLLKSTYESAFELARIHKLKHIAFPNISTGIYRFPKEEAAKIAIETARTALKRGLVKEVTFTCFDDENFEIYGSLLTVDFSTENSQATKVG